MTEDNFEKFLKKSAQGYNAPPVRRVEIPKGPGKVGTRPLGIPTVADRLLQRAESMDRAPSSLEAS